MTVKGHVRTNAITLRVLALAQVWHRSCARVLALAHTTSEQGTWARILLHGLLVLQGCRAWCQQRGHTATWHVPLVCPQDQKQLGVRRLQGLCRGVEKDYNLDFTRD